MKLYLKTKNVLDERETQEMYRIEHRGNVGHVHAAVRGGRASDALWRGLCAGRGRGFVIAVVSVGMIVAYARRGIWDADARPSTQGNALYAALCALGVTAVTFGLHANVAKAALFGATAFFLCFALLSALMAYVKQPPESSRATSWTTNKGDVGALPQAPAGN